jgi:hypothetical protein
LTQKFRDYSKFRMKTNGWRLTMQVCIKKHVKPLLLQNKPHTPEHRNDDRILYNT